MKTYWLLCQPSDKKKGKVTDQQFCVWNEGDLLNSTVNKKQLQQLVLRFV